MEKFKHIKKEAFRLLADFAQYDMKLYERHTEVMKKDMSMFAEEYQDQERQALWNRAMADRVDTFIDFKVSCSLIEDKIKPSFDNTTLIKQRMQFADEKGLTLTEATAEIDRYVNDPDLTANDILSQDTPYRAIYADALRRAGKIDDFQMLSQMKAEKEINDHLLHIRTRITELENASIHFYPYNSGNATGNMLIIQQYKEMQKNQD